MKIKSYSKDSNYLQKDNKNLFRIFSFGNNIDWSTAKILDFGCNQGNFLNYAKPYIDEKKYLGLDLNLTSIETARSLHPNFKFQHYNKWHRGYNPQGIKDLSADKILDDEFDVILLYSVFTHSTINETKKELNILRNLLTRNGKILFTIWEDWALPGFLSYIKDNYVNYTVKNIIPNFKQVCYLIDYSNIKVDTPDIEIDSCDSLCTFYKINSFREQFPNTRLIGSYKEIGVENNFQTLFEYTRTNV